MGPMINFRNVGGIRLAILGAATWGALSLLILPPRATAQSVRCMPVGARTSEVGCWILDHQSVGKLTSTQNYWHLDSYIPRKAAEDAKGPRGVVVESMGKVWLLSIEEAGWRAPGGEHVAQIGPLPITPGEEYSAQYMEAIFTPGMTSSVHLHGGPEAWYTLAGETCLETPDGKQVGRAGGEDVIVPGGLPMHLTATGTEKRYSLVLILHETSKPAQTQVFDWKPTGICTR
jgi:quercetin dioxygenase-like cupin family protein